MKKVLLSLLLLLSCSIRGFAQSPYAGDDFVPTYDCYDYVNGQYVIHITTAPGAGPIYYYLFTGTEPISGTTGYTLINPSGTTATLINADPVNGDTYSLQVFSSNRTYECLWLVGSYVQYQPPTEDELNFNVLKVAFRVCPCRIPCNSNFNYCTTYDPVNDKFVTTVSLHDQQSWNVYSVDFGDGGGIQTTFPATYSYDPTSTASSICVKAVSLNTETPNECVTCVNICLPEADPLKPGVGRYKEITTTGQAMNSFKDVKLYPNPTSYTSTLKFHMDNSEQLTIRILDISGRVVREISDGVRTEGDHSIEINTSDLTSGVYLISMQTGNTTSHYRLSVIK